MQEKKQLPGFVYLVIDSELLHYYYFIYILNKTPECIVILGKIRKANKKNWLVEGVF